MIQRVHSKRAFTLIEMMIALAVISLAATVIGWQVKKSLSFHRFHSEVADLFLAIQEAQVLALTYQTDLTLYLYTEQGKLTYRLDSDEPFSSFTLNRHPIALKQTAALTFNDKSCKQLQFNIYSNGVLEPCGILGFQMEEIAIWVDLQRAGFFKLTHQKPSLYRTQVPSKRVSTK